MKILFVARRFPPSVGGQQDVAYNFSMALSKVSDLSVLKYGGPKKLPVWSLTNFLFSSSFKSIFKKVDVIHFDDSVMAPMAWTVSKLGTPTSITAHGLDVTYKNKLYQNLIPKFLKRLPLVLPISPATKEECAKRGVSGNNMTILRKGVRDKVQNLDTDSYSKSKTQLLASLKITQPNPILLATTGRLVERKGVDWFINNVMTELNKIRQDIHYLVIGDGPMKSKILSSISNLQLENNVHFMGYLDDQDMNTTLLISDLFIVPNIPISGDMEGFGIANLEAATYKLPVIAANLEGIPFAIHDTKNGRMVTSMNPGEFISEILRFSDDSKIRENFGTSARAYTLDKFGWDNIAADYLKIVHQRFKLN